MLPAGSEFTGREVVNPFSDAFEEKWKIWLEYKKAVFKFEYKHPFTQQAALNELVEFSEGDEAHAWRIMNRSMANNWKGFYKTHNPKKDEKNAESTKKKAAGGVSHDDLKAVYIKRNGTEG